MYNFNAVLLSKFLIWRFFKNQSKIKFWPPLYNFLLSVCQVDKIGGGGNNLMIAEVVCLLLSRVSDIKLFVC